MYCGKTPGTKQVARLFEIGGPQWFVTVLVEKRLGQVYNKDVEGNRDGVQLTAYRPGVLHPGPYCQSSQLFWK